MARKSPPVLQLPVERQWATSIRTPGPDGVAISADGRSAWLYRKIPLGPVLDAISPAKTLEPGRAVDEALRAVEALTPPAAIKRRSAARARYREMHLLRLRVERAYRADPSSPLADYLTRAYGGRLETSSLLLFGVRLRPSSRRDTWWETTRAFVDTFVQPEADPAEFAGDARVVGSALSRIGLGVPTLADFALAESWWNHGGQPDPPYMLHADHVHLFGDYETARIAKRRTDAGQDCTEWDQMPRTISWAFGAVTQFDLPYVDGASPRAQWAARLLAHDAAAISVRGLVEPAEITRAELRAMRGKVLSDIRERHQEGQANRAEQDETYHAVTSAEAQYAVGGPPTLTNASVLVAFSGRDDLSGYSMEPAAASAGVTIWPMADRIEGAWSEMMLGSNTPANPYAGDLPSPLIACSGLPSLSMVGDREGPQLGFTEQDRQPVHINPMASVDEDSLPISVIVGQTGSGKACHVDTELVTPSGVSTFGRVQPGDILVGSDGRPCTVTFVTPVTVRRLWRVMFADGQFVDADADHQWLVDAGHLPGDWRRIVLAAADRVAAHAAGVPANATVNATQVRDVLSGLAPEPFAWSVSSVRAVLGFAGVGKGTASRYRARAAFAAFADRLRQRASDPGGRLVVCTAEMLAEPGMTWQVPCPAPAQRPAVDLPVPVDDYVRVRRRRIDPVYLCGSVAQRREFLLGYLSRHGWFDREHAGIDAAEPVVVDALVEVARSLGVIASHLGVTSARFAMGHDGAPTATMLGVERIEEGGSGPARCLTVDSPDASYLLAGHVVSHNTQAGLWLIDQASRVPNSRGERTPVIFPDLKAGSDFSALVKANHPDNRVYSLDRLLEAGGVFDPIRFTPNPEAGASIAGSILLFVNPWGTRKQDIEAALMHGLTHGATNGARTTMEAIDMAVDAGILTERDVRPVKDLASGSPQFRAVCGVDPEGETLRAGEGITYIRLGRTHLDLPSPNEMAQANVSQRVAIALVRAMVYGSLVALQDREGIVMLDEAWIFLEASQAEVVRAGRLARSWKVWLLLLTQRVKEIADAEISNFISRGGILPMEDREEAAAACRLFGLEPSASRLDRITAKGTKGEGTATVPNWASTRALIEPSTRRVLRGSIMLVADQHQRRVYTEVVLPPWFLRSTSTNRLDQLRTAQEAADTLTS